MITIIDAYIDSMLGKYKIRTVTAYKHDLIHFSNWVTAQHALIDIQNLSVSIVADYFEYILKNTVLTTTIRRKRAALRNFLDFCHKQNYNNLVL
ncbi:MAG: site-specific integrase, partial [Candidatus Dependentiae bacterium]|nr:site-specific integrase [Candidatus Dependentiae bacterium]